MISIDFEEQMVTLYVVQMYVGEFSDSAVKNLKAFRSFKRAQSYLEEKMSEMEDETSLVEWIAEKFDEYRYSYPEPKQQFFSMRECTEKGLDFAEEAPFWDQFYESEYRQAYEEWSENWINILTKNLARIGRELFVLDSTSDSADPRTDYRNFGNQRFHGRVEFGIDYVEAGD